MKASLFVGMLLWGVLLGGWGSASAGDAPMPSAGAIDAALGRALGADHQTALPGEDVVDKGAGEVERSRRRPWSSEMRKPPRSGGLAMLSTALLWTLVGAFAIVAVLWLVQALRQGPPREPGEVGAGADETDAAAAERAALVARPLGDAEQLAAQGRFEAALHALLLRTIEELARRLPTALPRAYTSREIVARVPMPEAARDALYELVCRVELSHFGSEPAGADDYAACRAHFERFAEVFVRGASR
ncbi:hypothetical protein [Haliangium ochraceum]|uniref:DUF4129 domain-containing protein n=1 Tax=Haliangium ochraceum (strain DSM 14365 / JCM 11303 / SMP-2) TaxID=502025 RepID=D0LSC7_HALO1|nr:hypothetical protein [Haliangium ochraceum]ACY15626.1 hypothetical protein Hoch_3124 [Haliangium ochraceum DSM 14365]